MHRVECCEILQHQPLFHPTNSGYVSFAICRVLLDRFVHFLAVVVRISRVGEVDTTHQFDALAVYHDRDGDGPFVDVFSINNSLPPLLVQHNSNARVCCRSFLLP